MPYETGSATSPTDLLQKLVAWLVARGWTSNLSQADGGGWRAHLVKGGLYLNLRSNIGSGSGVWGTAPVWSTPNYNGIGLYLGTGFNSGSAWHAQAGGPVGTGQTYTVGAWMQLPSGAITAYHFFDDGSDNVTVVVERTSGIFTHMGWGSSLAKAGAWTGGAYFFGALSSYYGSYSTGAGGDSTTAYCPGSHRDSSNGTNGFARADVDSFTGKWIGISDITLAQAGGTGKIGASAIEGSGGMPADIPRCLNVFMARQTSAMNSQANLVPVRWFAQRDGGGYSLLGRLPSILASNATAKGYSAGQEILIGADAYKVFPNFAVRKVS